MELLKPEFDADGQGGVVIAPAGGWSAADSLARSILAVRNRPVALVVDADAADARERQRFLENSLAEFGAPGTWQVFVAAPEIEALFFENADLLQQFTGREATAEQQLRSRFEPKQVLLELLGDQDFLAALHERLPQINLDPMRAAALVQELKAFLARVTAASFGAPQRFGTAASSGVPS
jgi:hypothetical protein